MDEPLTLNKKKQKKTGQYSIVTFDLFKPKGNKYPNFDFAKVQKKLGCADSDDDERFHDSDAREIVRRLEAKYPNKKTKSGKKVKYNEDDFIQKSLGYDMEDEFIDDSEAHDELVPSTLDTKKGGFYVNKGVLEFVSIGEEGSDEDSGDEDERPKRKKKEEEKAPVRAPKRPDQVKADEVKKADEAKKTADDSKKTLDSNPKKRSAISSSSSSSDEESEKEEARRVGGPPTLKRSKPSMSTVPTTSSSPAQVKKTDERASEPRRMTGAPPNLLRKKTEPVSRPSLAGQPPISSSLVKSAAEIPIETISSEEDDDSRHPEPSNTNGSGAGPSDRMEVDINEVPHPVQLKIVAFEALCQKHARPGRKHAADAVVDGAIEINELTNRLGMKKGLKGVVMEKLAQMCGYSRAGLEQRIKNSIANRTAAAASAPTLNVTTLTASASTTTPISQPVQQLQQQQQRAAPSSSNESLTSISSTSSESVVSVVAGPSNPAAVIGVKPQTGATVQRTGDWKKEPEKMIGMWTASQVQEALKKIPDDRDMVEACARQMSYEDFVKITTNPKAQTALVAAAAPAAAAAAASDASSISKWDQAKKAWRSILKRSDPNREDTLTQLSKAPQFIEKFTAYKQSLMRKHPLLGERAMLHMDIVDNADITKYFVIFLEMGKHFEKSPLYYLAYLDDMMKHFCGTYARTDRFIRHFLKNPMYKESLDRVRMLPEFTKMGQQFAEWESSASKMSHQMPPVKTAASNGKPAAASAAAAAAPVPSGSKPVLKQTQITQQSQQPLSQQQQLQQLQQQIQKIPQLAQLGQLNPQQVQALLTSLPGTSTQDSALQNMLIIQMQMLQQAHSAQEERAKKAKEEEERRILIAKAKAEEAEKKRKEKEEAAALKKAQKEEEKRLEKERKQKEAEEERKRKEEEKNKKMEEERQKRIREEEEKERRRKEEIERKLKEEAERKRIEEEVARKREELRIKQEEEQREREKKEMEERLREEEERAALMLADEVTMEMEEMDGVPRPLTQIEEVEVAEEEEKKRERERQVIAARELAMQRQNSMAMNAGVGSVKLENHDNHDKELLDSFFMGGSGDSSSQSSTTATVSGPVSSRETTNTASASSSSTTLHSFSDMKLDQGPMSMQTMMVQSPHIPAARFQNGSQYVQPSNPNTPATFVNSPFPSAAHASPHAMPSHSSPMMNASPSNAQMLSVCKSETSIGPPSGSGTPTSGGHRHNSFSSPSSSSHNLGSPQMMQQPQQVPQHQLQQPQQMPQHQLQQPQAFFPNQQVQSTTNGMHQQQQPVLPHAQPSMQRQNSQPSFSQLQQQPQHMGNMHQPVLQHGMQPQQMQQNMGNMQWQQPMMQQQQQQQQGHPPLPTPHPTPPHLQQPQHPMMQQQHQHGQMGMQQQQHLQPQSQMQQLQQQRIIQQRQQLLQQPQQPQADENERQRIFLERRIAEKRQTVAQLEQMRQQEQMMMMGGRGGGGMANQMGHSFPNQQQTFQPSRMQQPQPQPRQPITQEAMQLYLIQQQNAQMEAQRAARQQAQQNHNMNRHM